MLLTATKGKKELLSNLLLQCYVHCNVHVYIICGNYTQHTKLVSMIMTLITYTSSFYLNFEKTGVAYTWYGTGKSVLYM